jgi:ABC-type bacteriocin/lantibiotic exporter with double-glycine peptidase domain
MNLVLQKPKSSCCGQCCVAMVAGIKLKASYKIFGTKGGTTTKAVRRALDKLGYQVNERLLTFRHELALPSPCILVLRFPKEVQRAGHWVVYDNGLIYCPSLGIYPYIELCAREGVKCTSYLGFTPK